MSDYTSLINAVIEALEPETLEVTGAYRFGWLPQKPTLPYLVVSHMPGNWQPLSRDGGRLTRGVQVEIMGLGPGEDGDADGIANAADAALNGLSVEPADENGLGYELRRATGSWRTYPPVLPPFDGRKYVRVVLLYQATETHPNA